MYNDNHKKGKKKSTKNDRNLSFKMSMKIEFSCFMIFITIATQFFPINIKFSPLTNSIKKGTNQNLRQNSSFEKKKGTRTSLRFFFCTKWHTKISVP